MPATKHHEAAVAADAGKRELAAVVSHGHHDAFERDQAGRPIEDVDVWPIVLVGGDEPGARLDATERPSALMSEVRGARAER